MSTTKPLPAQFQAYDGGFRLGDWEFVRQAILNQNSMQATYGIAAAGTTQATATQLAAVLNQVDTVAASTGVNLPLSTGKHSTPCQFVFVTNNGANTLQIYGAQSSTDTINGVAAATGVPLAAGASAGFYTTKGGAWFSGDSNEAETVTSLILTGSSSGSTTLVASAVAAGTETLPGFSGVNTLLAGPPPVTNPALATSVSTTTMAAIAGMTVTVVTSGIYDYIATLSVTTNATAGIKAGLLAGTATATYLQENIKLLAAASVSGVVSNNTLGTGGGASANAVLAELSGVIQVNTGGTLNLGFAQNASTNATTTINTNGFLQFTRIS